EQLFLAAEVAIDRFLRDARAASHRVDARALVTVLEEVRGGDIEHFLLLRLRPCGALGQRSNQTRNAARRRRHRPSFTAFAATGSFFDVLFGSRAHWTPSPIRQTCTRISLPCTSRFPLA